MQPAEVREVAFRASVGILERVGTGYAIDPRVLAALTPQARRHYTRTVRAAVSDEEHTGVMVACYPTPEQAQQLALEDGETPESIHVTLAYLGHVDDLTDQQVQDLQAIVEKVAGTCAPLDGEFGGVGRFTADGSPDGDPVFATVDVPGLGSLRETLCQELAAAGLPLPSEHGFTPHSTLCYVDSDAQMPVRRQDPVPATLGALSAVVGPDRTDYPLVGVDKPVVAAAAPDTTKRVAEKESRKLVQLDRDLRSKLHVAANGAMKRTLERAGAKLITKSRTASCSALRPYVERQVPPYRIPLITPRALLASLGLDAHVLLDTAFDDLRDQFDRWVDDTQRAAARTAAQIVRQNPQEAQRQLQRANDISREQAWRQLQLQLQARASSLLDAAGDDGTITGDNLVPVGFLRTSLALAGGVSAVSAGIGRDGQPVDPDEVLGQIGTGGIVGTYLEGNGATQDSFEWVHGATDRPFPPHEELDGVTFENFDDSVLAVDGDFPDTTYNHPGDHDGCGCDAITLWATTQESASE